MVAMPGREIVGQVADVEDEYVLIINRGRHQGVRTGMIFSIKASDGVPVIDPETNIELGRRYPEKLRVKVIEVEDRYCRAATYRRISGVQLGGGLLASAFSTTREKISASANNPVRVVEINVGDTARELPEVSEED